MAASFVNPVITIEGALLYKAEVELKETESNKRRALENLQKGLQKLTKSGKTEVWCDCSSKNFVSIL